MRFKLHHLLLLLFAQKVDSFVYSCDEIVTKVLSKSSIEKYTKYAYVYTKDGFTNSAQLKQIYLKVNDAKYSFYEVSRKGPPVVVNDDFENVPWVVEGDEPEANCDQEFTLIFKSDEYEVVRVPEKHNKLRSEGQSFVFVVPQVGMWINKASMRGEGNISVYTGAGNGEEEGRFLLQSWPCESMPDWIFSLESVITLETDESCSFLLLHSYDLSLGYRVTIFDHDRLLVLVNGRSCNLQNREGIGRWAYFNIGQGCGSNVTLYMELSFDSGSTGHVTEMRHFSGALFDYWNGTYYENFESEYMEIRYNPNPVQLSEISRNQDNIYVDIQISPIYDDFDCPAGYSLVPSNDGQHWCYIIIWPVPPKTGFTFSDAKDTCESTGDSLPIVSSDDINQSVWQFIISHFAIESMWIGIVCDTESDFWIWQDEEGISYTNFEPKDEQGLAGCSDSKNHFALDIDNSLWYSYQPDTQFSYVVCGRRATSTTMVITSDNIWIVPVIIVCIILLLAICFGIILIVRRRMLSLRAQVVEVQLEIAKSSQTPQTNRYYDIPGKNNAWEIERKFVSIDYSRRLGEGAFGSVYLGRVLAKNIPPGVGRSIIELSSLTNNNNSVAVKMLLENADSQTEKDFRDEINLMKSIGFHERLVNMLACVTRTEPILLIIEHCANGDLLAFMRLKRQNMIEHPDETDSSIIITVKKQLMFAIQIAFGLEYLSSQGFIHRDIAARNILVDHHESCKIGDFGLARAIGKDGKEDCNSPGGKLPLRWMAPESIENFYFSTETDVFEWSFGILLYEIVTLGGSPYAGWPADKLLSRLKKGVRMERPDNCSENLFEIMCNCWAENPSDRPLFAKLRKLLGDLLDDTYQDDYDYYLKLNAKAHYYELESNASD